MDQSDRSAAPTRLEVNAGEHQLRLDQFLRRHLPRLSRGEAHRLLDRGMVRVDGRPAAKGLRLRQGQQVQVDAAAQDARPRPQPELPLVLLATTSEVVAMNKPAGLPCHPLAPGETGTVVNALVARHPECADASPVAREGGLAHRLDHGTSGVLLAARTRVAHQRLRAQFSGGEVSKEYLALVDGEVTAEGQVAGDLRSRPGDPTRMELCADTALLSDVITTYRPQARLGRYTLVSVNCSTGQRHQVRVHLAHAGMPVAGDPLYGGSPLPAAQGALLHASRVVLPDGTCFEAPLPPERQQIVDSLSQELRAKS